MAQVLGTVEPLSLYSLMSMRCRFKVHADIKIAGTYGCFAQWGY